MVARARSAAAAIGLAVISSAGALSPSNLVHLPIRPPPPPAAAPLAIEPVVAVRATPKLIGDLVDRRRAARGASVDAETRCLAETVFHEASNQPLEGQLAVAELIVRRVRSPAFPKTICGVIGQPGQFSAPGRAVRAASEAALRTAVAVARIAREASAPEVAPGALFFHASYAEPAGRGREIARIGDQVFYR